MEGFGRNVSGGVSDMRETIEFYFDPLCPWAWQGAVWIRQVEEVRDIRVDWRLFSLFLINEHREEFGPEVRDQMLSPLREALEAAALDPALVDRALADPSTEGEVIGEHEAIVERVGAFGVPTIVLQSGRGIFGTVKEVAPLGEAAGELWDHVRWITYQEDFFELKRIRDRKPGRAA